MGMEDLSLDDIIKKRKTGQKRFNNKGTNNSQAVRNNQSFQRKRFFNPESQTKVIDARLLLQKKAKVTDAREKIKPKTVIDARQKIEQNKYQEKNFGNAPRTLPLTGKIPKVTITNTDHHEKQRGIPKITFHVTSARKPASFDRSKRNDVGHTVSSRLGTGIKVAVKNELATSMPRTTPAPNKKDFERLKITTINKDAIKPKPIPVASPSKPIRKRTLPESDDTFEEAPTHQKPRKQQRVQEEEEEEVYQMKHVKLDNSSLRPMISRAKRTPSDTQEEEVEALTGPSPIEGTKLRVLNLHPVVTEDDILELFSVLGAVRRARLVKPGEAEVVYVRSENAFAAYKKYNNRDLDGQPMQIKFATNEMPKQAVQYSWMKEVKSSRKKTDPGGVTELHSGVLQQALFKGGSTGTSTRPVVFTVKI